MPFLRCEVLCRIADIVLHVHSCIARDELAGDSYFPEDGGADQ
jgi:hypothetical protein